jgi:hypothetical protein
LVCFSQNEINTQSFLKQYQDSLTLLKEVPDNKVPNPYISDIEFRSRTGDFLLDRQRYQLRLKLVDFKANKIESNLYSYYEQEAITAAQLRHQQNFYIAVKDWVLMYQQNKTLHLYDSLRTVLKDKKYVLSQEISSGEATYLELFKAEKELYNTSVSLSAAQKKISSLCEVYSLSEEKNSISIRFQTLFRLKKK